MKFNAYLAIIAMAALCASCVKEPVAGDGVGQTSGKTGIMPITATTLP